MPKSSRRQFLIRVAGIDGYWSTKSGGNKDVPVTKVFDGGSSVADILTGNPDITNVTVSRPYDRDRDGQALASWLRMAGHWTTSVAETDTDEDLVPAGATRTYQGKLVGVHPPEHDATSGDGAMIELVFAVREVG